MLFRYPFVAMGSGCEILIDEERERDVKPLLQSALASIQQLERKYSYFQESSFLSTINREAFRRPVQLDGETSFLFESAARMHAATAGAFDPTVGSLRGCWNFGAMALPDETVLREKLAAVGWEHVHLEGSSLRLDHPQTRIDFGGLVKEYAIDVAVSVLQALGVRRGLVNLGGDLRLIGDIGETERPFFVGVAHPRRHHGTCATLGLRRGAVVTSGDYQRYFLRDGQRYHHLLDPRGGYPLVLGYTGVTAHGTTALDALAACKAMILPPAPSEAKEPEGAYVACGISGDPVAWRESPACTFSIQGQPRKAIA
jgi:thiamine biosynthesis lipoprotein